MKTFLLKLDVDVHQKWSDAAAVRKMTLSEFIRSTVNAQLGSSNGNAAVHDAGRTAGVRTPKRSVGASGGFDPTERVAIVDIRKEPDLKSAVRAAGFPASLAHSPNCPCMLCESKRKKVKK